MKKFWNIFKKVMLMLGVLTVVVLFVFTLTSAVKQQKTLVCSSIQVKIDYESGLSFLTTDQVIAQINNLSNGDIVGKPLTSLDFRAIEKGLLQDPYIDKARVYVDHAQNLHADVIQKQPVMRIINNDGVSYYISNKRDKMPLCSTFTAHVPLAIGMVEDHQDLYGDSISLAQLFSLALYLNSDSLAGSMIDHVYMTENGELVMYPKFGHHTIEFGKADDTMKEKFEKLKIFYTEGLAKVGWDKYKVIDLRFANQVVCKKASDEPKEKEKPKEETTDEDATDNTETTDNN